MCSIWPVSKLYNEGETVLEQALVEKILWFFKRLLDWITDYGADELINGLLEMAEETQRKGNVRRWKQLPEDLWRNGRPRGLSAYCIALQSVNWQ
jgi:hypothetical protein